MFYIAELEVVRYHSLAVESFLAYQHSYKLFGSFL